MGQTIAFALLSAACGFGAAVWILVARENQPTHPLLRVGYLLLAAAYIAIGALLVARIINRPFPTVLGVTTLLLGIVLVVPPAIHLAGWLKGRRLIDQQRREP